MNNYIPPLIEDWIINLNKITNPLHIRENYYNSVKTLRDLLSDSIKKFEKEREKENIQFLKEAKMRKRRSNV